MSWEENKKAGWVVIRSGFPGFFHVWPKPVLNDGDELVFEGSHDEAQSLALRLNKARSYLGIDLNAIPVQQIVAQLGEIELRIA